MGPNMISFFKKVFSRPPTIDPKKTQEEEETVLITPAQDEDFDFKKYQSSESEFEQDDNCNTLNSNFYCDEKGSWRHYSNSKVCFRDTGDSLIVKDKKDETYKAVMELAVQKGWTAIELSGKGEAVSKAWLEASLLGIEVTNYKPTEKDIEDLNRRKAEKEILLVTHQESPSKADDKPSSPPDQPPGSAKSCAVKLPSTGIWIGSVQSIQDGYVFQKASRYNDDSVCHPISDFDTIPKVGEIIEVQYKNGKANLIIPEEKTQSHTRERTR